MYSILNCAGAAAGSGGGIAPAVGERVEGHGSDSRIWSSHFATSPPQNAGVTTSRCRSRTRAPAHDDHSDHLHVQSCGAQTVGGAVGGADGVGGGVGARVGLRVSGASVSPGLGAADGNPVRGDGVGNSVGSAVAVGIAVGL
jgi:hypothetical protein